MSTRRDFLAFTAGAIAARTVLPIAARAEPNRRLKTAYQRELLLVFRQLGDAEQIALLRGLQRNQAGMPFEEAVRGIYVELGREPPDRLPGGVA